MQWRKFQFFERELVKDPESKDPQRPTPHKALSVCFFQRRKHTNTQTKQQKTAPTQELCATCVTSGRGLLILGGLYHLQSN